MSASKNINVCWREDPTDGIRKHICETGLHDNAGTENTPFSTMLLIQADGDAEHACCDDCLCILSEDDDGEEREIKLLGITPTGHKIYCLAKYAKFRDWSVWAIYHENIFTLSGNFITVFKVILIG